MTARVLRDCQKKVCLLCDKVSINACGLDSSSFKRRKWSAFRISLEKGEIESLRRTIEKAQTTLILAKVISIDRSIFSRFASQQKTLQHIAEAITIAPNSKAFTCSVSANLNMQLLDSDPRSRANHKSAEIDISTDRPSAESQESLVPMTPHQPFRHKRLQEVACRRLKMQTPLGHFTAWSTTRKATAIQSERSLYPVEQETVYSWYPSYLLAKLGVKYGLSIQARYTDGWQYSIQPFNAVPDDALIFTFCSEGNVAAVKALLTSGKASLRDRDSDGRTALWYATKSLGLDMAKFLLQQGADIHTTDWSTRRSPIAAIADSAVNAVAGKLSMLELFRQYSSDDFDEMTVLNLIGLSLLFYRPYKLSSSLSSIERDVSALMLLRTLLPLWDPNNDWRTVLIHEMFLLRYGPGVLYWTLSTFEDKVAESERFSIIHDAVAAKLPLRCSRTMNLFIHKTTDLHRPWGSATIHLSTPTSLAMYQPALFFAWKDALVNAGVGIQAYVEREILLERSPLAQQGWSKETLNAIFTSREQLFPCSDSKKGSFQFKCQRCGRWEDSHSMMVDLQWRLFLQGLRNGVRSSSLQLEGPVDQIVCSQECLDGICVAWIYDDNTGNPGDEKFDPQLISDTGSGGSFDECPTKGMPGAFV
ncbi:uncharacterized protein PAC_19359 [Phialocephala subalpina]|uniref:Uncharacterized protein n=1 Tax=Phialocephala subalpina TaxID=576137 RepID=A0A1L7XWV1_9HELO|nr:uncharacterized protein PAC_19359 [Phialocephala subalpina]